jgi:hypothetical protein
MNLLAKSEMPVLLEFEIRCSASSLFDVRKGIYVTGVQSVVTLLRMERDLC